jgi:hypothetical protein
MPLVDPATIATFRFRMGLTFSVRYDQPLDGCDDSKKMSRNPQPQPLQSRRRE